MNRIWLAVLLAVLIIATYAPALKNDFAFDDRTSVESNTALDRPIREWLFTKNYFWVSKEFSYRPIVSLTHILDHRYGPYFGHSVNMALHFSVCWLLFTLAASYISFRAAAIGSILFAIHPAYSEVIYLITYREDMLCAIGILTSLIFGIRGNVYACSLAYGAALFSKESALPFLIFVILLASLREFKSLRKSLPSLLLITGGYCLLRFVFLKHYYVLHSGHYQWFPVESAVLTEFLRLLLFPSSLTIDYSIPARPGFWEIWPGMAMGVLGVYFALKFYLKKDSAFAPFAWTILFIIPVMNILPLPNICAERYLYLPMLIPFAAVGFWLDRGIGFLGTRDIRFKLLAVPVLCWFVFLGVRGHQRGYDFKNNETLYTAAMNVNPRSRMMAWSLGQIYFFQDKFDKSRMYLQKSLDLDPNFYPALIDMGRLNLQVGKRVEAGEYFERAAEVAPLDPLALLMLAAYRMNMGDTPAAKPIYQLALRLPPSPAFQGQDFLDLIRTFRALSLSEKTDSPGLRK